MEILKINIYILDRGDSELELCLRRSELPPNTSCLFHSVASITQEALESRGVIIAREEDVTALCASRGEGCAVVCRCAATAKLDRDVLKNVCAVWREPMSEDELSFSFSKLIKAIKDEYDAWLYKNLLDTAINTFPDMVWFKNLEGLHILVNDAFCRTVHKTKDDVTNKGHCYIWDIQPEDVEKGECMCLESDKEIMSGHETRVFEEPVKTKDGMKQLRSYKTPIFGRDGNAIGNMGTAHDVTDISNIDSELNLLIENMPFPIIVCDKNWGVVKYNLESKKAFSIKESFVGSDYRKWRESFFRNCVDISPENGNSFQAELTLLNGRNSGAFSLIECPIKDMFGYVSGYYCLFSDITAKKLHERNLLLLVHTDPLTQLYNRRYFFKYMEGVKNEPLTFYFMDMDNFKVVNDTLGHKYGDYVLTATAAIIKEVFPEGLVARIGGDEFVAVIRGKRDDDENRLMTKLLMDKVEGAFNEEPLAGIVGISVGIAQTDGSDKDLDDLFAESDMQMYRQKNVNSKFRMPLRSHRRAKKRPEQ